MEQRDYHLKAKDFIPFVGLIRYHNLRLEDLIKKGPINKEFCYSFLGELGFAAYNTVLSFSALVGLGYAVAGLEKLFK